MADIDPTETARALDALNAEQSADARGAILEEVCATLFESMDGVVVAARNALTARGNEELDLLLVNEQLPMGLPGFSRDIPVECKSQGDPVSSNMVRDFAAKLERTFLDWGILVALAGITGEKSGWRAAIAEIDTCALKRRRIIVVVERELRALRSGEHLAQLLEKKRAEMLVKRFPYIASPEELEALNPHSRRTAGVRIRTGAEELENAVRLMRRDRLSEVIEAAKSITIPPIHDASKTARLKLRELEESVDEHDPDEDPFGLSIRPIVVATGAAIAHLLGDEVRSEHFERAARVNIEIVNPGRLRAGAGTELWNLLTDYYLREAEEPHEQSRDTSIYALLSLVVAELVSIDDIEPPYDDWPDPS
jgi:hypothetical protein